MLKFSPYFLLIIFLAGCAAASKMNSPAFAKNPVVAHRGEFKKNGFPENSIFAAVGVRYEQSTYGLH
jgi:hypothetical protein